MTTAWINSIDCCTSGMERLRFNDEVLLVTYYQPGMTVAETIQGWRDDINSYDHKDAALVLETLADAFRANETSAVMFPSIAAADGHDELMAYCYVLIERE